VCAACSNVGTDRIAAWRARRGATYPSTSARVLLAMAKPPSTGRPTASGRASGRLMAPRWRGTSTTAVIASATSAEATGARSGVRARRWLRSVGRAQRAGARGNKASEAAIGPDVQGARPSCCKGV
jgi:hypothetical protein